MSKNNKYYTPELEDIHLGIECEYTSCRNCFYEDEVIVGPLEPVEFLNIIKWTIEDCDELSDFIRIKYLDKDDVSLLGWKYIENKKGPFGEALFSIDKEIGFNTFSNYTMLIPQKLTGELMPENGHIRIHNHSEGSWSINNDFVFNGRIKNKSELKQIMKMLNIKP